MSCTYGLSFVFEPDALCAFPAECTNSESPRDLSGMSITAVARAAAAAAAGDHRQDRGREWSGPPTMSKSVYQRTHLCPAHWRVWPAVAGSASSEGVCR